jgi:hypothetical protein
MGTPGERSKLVVGAVIAAVERAYQKQLDVYGRVGDGLIVQPWFGLDCGGKGAGFMYYGNGIGEYFRAQVAAAGHFSEVSEEAKARHIGHGMNGGYFTQPSGIFFFFPLSE